MNDVITKKKSGLEIEHFARITDCYTPHVRHFIRWCDDRAITEVTEDCVRRYFAELNHSGLRAGTIRVKRSAVKKRIRQLMEAAPLDDQVRLDRLLSNLDTFGDTRAPKIATQAVMTAKVISESERMMLIAAATPRLGHVLELLWMTGLRISEALNIRVSDCTVEGEVVDIVVLGKGRKERHVQIRRSLYDKIRTLYHGQEYLFATQRGRPYDRVYIAHELHKLALRVLGRSVSPHCYRHSFATRKIRSTGNLKGVSVYLGHASTSVTSSMYDHNMLSAAELLSEAEIL